MLLLDAINEVLPKLGERPVTSTESKSPTLAVIIPQINASKRNLLTRGWWFNTFPTTLYPDAEKFIDVPNDTLKFLPTDRISCIARGERFYDGSKQSFLFDAAIKGVIVQNIPFEELPESVAQRVLYEALVVIYATDIGLEAVVQMWTALSSAAVAAMEAEHLENMRYTTKDSRRYRHLRQAMRG